MEDKAILRLFQERDESAITRADQKYGKGCRMIVRSILSDPQDVEETLNEMWLRVWNAIPPAHPENLFAFLSAAARNCALNRAEAMRSMKRGSGERPTALEELSECIGSGESVEETVDARLLTEAVERFLDALPAEKRMLFVERYTNLRPVAEIAEEFGFSESKVKVTLLRTRNELKTYLEKEGFL